jgi:hypothetical protein
MHPNSFAQSSEMPLHGTGFIEAGILWSFLVMFAQQRFVGVCPATTHDALSSAGGIA